MAFHLQMDVQTKQQNSTMQIYLQAFVNFEQKNWARLLLMSKFVYSNAKNATTGNMAFELNYGYHPQVSYKKDINSRSKSKLADKLSVELQGLMIVC